MDPGRPTVRQPQSTAMSLTSSTVSKQMWTTNAGAPFESYGYALKMQKHVSQVTCQKPLAEQFFMWLHNFATERVTTSLNSHCYRASLLSDPRCDLYRQKNVATNTSRNSLQSSYTCMYIQTLLHRLREWKREVGKELDSALKEPKGFRRPLQAQ